MSAYERLLTLAKLEHELAVQRDIDGLERLDAERRQIVATLPARPPAAAKPMLVEMARIQAETTRVLKEARAEIAREMGDVDRTSATAATYGLQATPRTGTFSITAS